MMGCGVTEGWWDVQEGGIMDHEQARFLMP